ncbi:hypothetical protein L9F63_019110, partial [Diploptera punctata]
TAENFFLAILEHVKSKDYGNRDKQNQAYTALVSKYKDMGSKAMYAKIKTSSLLMQSVRLFIGIFVFEILLDIMLAETRRDCALEDEVLLFQEIVLLKVTFEAQISDIWGSNPGADERRFDSSVLSFSCLRNHSLVRN